MSSIRAQVEELGSWITGFEFEGTRYGGDYFPNDDSRVLRFVDAFRQWLRELPDRRRALRILECGCLEGGHTALLAKAFPEAEIVATDLCEENLRKARFLVSLYGLHNVRWLQDDFSSPHTVFCQEYDAIFCVGLLYHLRDPANFLKRTAQLTNFLWLWTVICAEAEASITEAEFRGRMLGETPDHPLSGAQPQSFLPTLGSLTDMLFASGFKTVRLLQKEMTSNNNGPCILLQADR